MLLRLSLLLTLVPLTDLALLVWLARETDVVTAVLVVIVTGLAGAVISRWQGLRAWRAVRADLAAGRLPAASILDGVLILVAGALLVSPGLITDTCGFLLLIPPIRAAARNRIYNHLRRRISMKLGKMAAHADGFASGDVIDAEFRRADSVPIEYRHLE